MTFKFKIEGAYEIHRDPEGHYHHWTILYGFLIEGTLCRGNYIAIPSCEDTLQASIILDFDAGSEECFNSINETQKATVLDKPIELQMRTWHPVPVDKDIVLGVAVACTPEAYIKVIVDSWTKYQKHYQSVDSRPVFKRVPETEALLKELAKHSDPELIKLAEEALQYEQSKVELILPRRQWWHFW